MQKIDIFGSGIQSVSPDITAQRRVNVYYDIRQDGDKNQVVVCSTPGLTRIFTLPTSPVRGWEQYLDYLFVVAGNALYIVSPSATFAFLGNIGSAGVTSPVDMDLNEIQLLIVDGNTGYVINLEAVLTLLMTQNLVVINQLSFAFNVFNAIAP